MVLLAEDLGNLITAGAFLVGAIYGIRLQQTFKGDKLARSYSLIVWALVVVFATFLISSVLDVAGVIPVFGYGISVKDIGVLVAGVLIVASLREASRVWELPVREVFN